MIKKFGFHHFIFALFPVLLIYLDNINETPIHEIIVPLILSLGIILIPWIALTYFIGERKASVIISLLIIIFLIFAYVRSILIYNEIIEIRFIAKNIILIPMFSIPAIFIIYKILRQKFSSNITQIINVISIAIFSFMIFQIILFYSTDTTSYDEAQKLLNVPVFEINELNYTPNVYLLMLDAYSGQITLKKDFNFDNSEFYQQLEKRGFFIQKESYSNYPNTALSIPSIMNMNYLDFVTEIQGKNSTDLRLVQKLMNNNKVMQVFQSAGYEIYSFHGSSVASTLATENFCRTNLNLNPELTYSLANYYIPISIIRENLVEKGHYDSVLCILDKTKNFESQTNTPFYMHMHVKLPHQPLVFDSEGKKIEDVVSSTRFDSELKDAYLQQVIFTNKKTLEIIDEIQKRNPNNVIILMSDHGGRFGVNWDNPSEMDYFRGFNNLHALYFPGQESNLPTNVSTVNTFRIFFNIYFNTNYEILDEKFIWYSPEKPFVQNDVTELVKSSYLRN